MVRERAIVSLPAMRTVGVPERRKQVRYDCVALATRPRGVTPVCNYSLTHLPDQVLLRGGAALATQDHVTTAALLAHIAEIDARKLYLPAGYPSMFCFCLNEYHLCEQAAFKRILAARTARKFPAIFDALEDGRLHLSAVVLIAPHLSAETVDELLEAAAYKSKSGIEKLLAKRFPRPDVPTRIQVTHASPVLETRTADPSASERVEIPTCEQLSPGIVQVSAGLIDSTAAETAPAPITALVQRPRSHPSRPSASRSSSPWARARTTNSSMSKPC